jgi:hypothetical protein
MSRLNREVSAPRRKDGPLVFFHPLVKGSHPSYNFAEMIQAETVKTTGETLVTAWSAVGPLLGVLVGAYIANRNQRKQWLLDNKKEEYRELLSALSTAFLALLDLHTPMVARPAVEAERLRSVEGESYRIIRDRLFIASEIREARIMGLCTEATRDLDQDWDLHKFAQRFDQLNKTIVFLATGN